MEDSMEEQEGLSMDDHQDIARSSYADMLHDDERNVAYYQAIMASVGHLVRSKETNPKGDRFFKCCDIGTGSGLLSMMIVRTFRNLNYTNFSVTAFEAFKPMAECAKRVIALNGMSKEITVIPTRAEDYKGDESPQFDLLVAELLDTELIGEGCLLTYRFAVENLCSPECVFIPDSAQIYIQPLNSKYHHSRQKIQELKLCWGLLGSIDVPDEEARECCGLSEIDDLHLNDNCRLMSDELASPQLAFEIKFSKLDSLKLRDHTEVQFKLKQLDKESQENCYPVLVMWWDIVMYPRAWYALHVAPQGVHQLPFDVLSCAPEWIWQRNYRERNQLVLKHYQRDIWREHWLRGVYHMPNVHLMPKPTTNESSSEDGKGPPPPPPPALMTVHAYHDSHSLWFDLKPCETKLPPSCSCNVHRLLSRSEIAFINDTDMMSRLTLGLFRLNPVTRSESIKKQICEKAKLVFNYSPYDLEPKWKVEFHYYEFVHIYQKKLIDLRLQDDVCWLGLMRRHLADQPIEPFVDFTIKCAQVFFEDLNRIRLRVGTCEGFDLSPLDELIDNSSALIDASVESRHLYEYRCRDRIKDFDNRMKEIKVFTLSDATAEDNERLRAGSWTKRVKLEAPSLDYAFLRTRWAVIFWADLELANGRMIDTGFWTLGNAVRFSPHFKQLVHFLHDHPVLEHDDGSRPSLELELRLSSASGLTVKRVRPEPSLAASAASDAAAASPAEPTEQMDVGA